MKKRWIIYLLSLILSVGFLSNCKKYPENRLFLRRPVGIVTGDWRLESYIVDGIDSTAYGDINVFTENKFKFMPGETQGTFGARDKGGSAAIGAENSSPYLSSSWFLDDNDKTFGLRFDNTLGYSISNVYGYQKNIFNKGKWKIEKLKGKQMWLSNEQNGIKYEIKFKR